MHSEAAVFTGTYVVCLDCSRELPYDWSAMKVLSPRQMRQQQRVHQTQHAQRSQYVNATAGDRIALK